MIFSLLTFTSLDPLFYRFEIFLDGSCGSILVVIVMIFYVVVTPLPSFLDVSVGGLSLLVPLLLRSRCIFFHLWIFVNFPWTRRFEASPPPMSVLVKYLISFAFSLCLQMKSVSPHFLVTEELPRFLHSSGRP